MEPADAPAIMLQAEKALAQPVHARLLALCPTMDLVAVVTQEEQLDVYRFGGQRAFGLKRKSLDSTVDSICWKFNGQYIAVGWDDGTVDVVSAETGQVLQHLRHVTGSATKQHASNSERPQHISCIGWGLNFIDPHAVKTRVGSMTRAQLESRGQDSAIFTMSDPWDIEGDDITLDDFLERQPDRQKLKINPSLPDQLALMDVENLLPRLPVIPALQAALGQKVPDIVPAMFSSQASVDAVFHSYHTKDPNAVGVLCICYANGVVQPVLYDSLAIGNIAMPAQWGFQHSKPLLHASHPYSCSHMLLVQVPGRQASASSRLALVPLSLRFVQSAGINLHIITSKTAQLQNLLRYIRASIGSISHHWTHSQDLPSKFMRNINETLAEKGEGTLVQGLYHVAVTGHCPPTIKIWLVDELTERGHKRWDHAVSHGYAKIMELIQENLLPALDRCSIVVSRLKGLAAYHESTSVFDVPQSFFINVLEALRCLRLLGHTLLKHAAEERRQFVVFSKWLRHEIDVQATDPTSSSAEETAEQDLGLDYNQLLGYIRSGMTDSKLLPFMAVGIASEEVSADGIREAAERLRKGTAGQEHALAVASSLHNLEKHSQSLVSQITQWQLSNSTMDCGLVLEEVETTTIMDMRMTSKPANPSTSSATPDTASDLATYIAVVPSAARNQIRLHCIVHAELSDDISRSVRAIEAATYQLGGGEIRDLKFVDDDVLMVIYNTQDASYLLSMPYDKTSPGKGSSKDFELPDGHAGGERTVMDFSQPKKLQPFVRHVFQISNRFKPLKLDVNGRKDRRVACVLGEDLKHYKIFDLDHVADENGNHEMGKADSGGDTIMIG